MWYFAPDDLVGTARSSNVMDSLTSPKTNHRLQFSTYNNVSTRCLAFFLDRVTLENETDRVSRNGGRLRLKCDGTRPETRFCLSTKRTSPFKSAGASVQSTTGRRAVHISLQGLYCSCKPVFCSHVTFTGYPLHSIVSPSLLLTCLTVCHHISKAVYTTTTYAE
jgi:hypothetical protein